MRTKGYLWGAVGLALFAAAGCDQKLAVQPAREHPALADEGSPTAGYSAASYGEARTARATSGQARGFAGPAQASEPVKLVNGHPMWSENRRHSAAENAEYQFEHHGAELGAKSLDEFVAKADRFLNAPPQGALTLTRANGDKLMFDPKSGLFGVVRSDGAPRTLFKPDDGRAYWDQQVATGGDGRTGTSRRRTAARDGADDRS